MFFYFFLFFLPPQNFQQFRGACQQDGLVVLDKMVAAGADLIRDPAGYGEYIAVIGIGKFGGDHAAALYRCFHQHGCVTESGHDAVAQRKIMPVRLCAAEEFREDATALFYHVFRQRRIFIWIYFIQPMTHNTYRPEIVLQGRSVGGGVDAESKAADDQDILLRQVRYQLFREGPSVFGLASCSHDRQDFRGIEIGIALVKKKGGRIVAIQ